MTNKYAYLVAISLLIMVFVQCKTESGTLTTPSGYDYEILHSGNGDKPVKGDFVYFEMDIMDAEGNIVNSMRNLAQTPSVQIPEERDPNGQNALLDMLAMSSTGDTLKLIVPIDSMPGAKMQFPNSTHFEYLVNVVEVVDKNTYTERLAAEQETAQAVTASAANTLIATMSDYKSKKLENLVKLPSGLEYVIHEEGAGDVVPVGEKITANYYGVLKSDGSRFDDSFSKGRPFSFTLGRGEVIKGWDEGMGLLKKGSKATLFIPYAMAYGEAGRPGIPAKSDLVFYVEIAE